MYKLVDELKAASKVLGLKVEDPYEICLTYGDDMKDLDR
jgi:hypothetical protein